MKLICLPFAGGSSFAFKELKSCFNESISVVPLEYPGHGTRFTEPLCNTFQQAFNDVYEQLLPLIDSDYALLGHSMGALFVYELVKKLDSDGRKMPLHLFVSGAEVPHQLKTKGLWKLPQAEFMQELKKMGGMPDEIIEDQELSDLFYPILKNDIKINEQYRIDFDSSTKYVTQVPLTVLCGMRDEDFQEKDAIGWQEYAHQKIRIFAYDEGHFFLFKKKEAVCKTIEQQLQ